MTLAPWDYLFVSFNSQNFPDIFHPTWIASLILLAILTLLYNVRTRALHRHAIYLEMWEWLWWTGLITFSLLIVESLFVFDYFIVLLTEIIGIGTLVWIRFFRFPPLFAAYEQRSWRASATSRGRSSPTRRPPSRSARRRPSPAAPAAPPPLAGSPRADRDPPVRGRPPAPGWPDRLGRPDRPDHSIRDGRGTVSELAFARNARIEPHANPNSTCSS